LPCAALPSIIVSMAESFPLRNLLDTAPDGFVVVDPAGRIVWANQTAHVLFGYDGAELLGRAIEDLVPARLREEHRHHRGTYTEHPHGRPMGLGLDLLGRRKDGSEFPVEISLSPFESDSGLLVTAVVRDVSERKAQEEERNILALELETERERDRIAMDLHDGVMQDIYAIALGLELSVDGETADAAIVERSIGRLHDVIRSIRSFIFDLRPREFSGSLAEALSNLAEEFAQNSQIPAHAEVDASIEVDEQVATVVYHIAHEGLSNVRKHAGATNVVLRLVDAGGESRLEIVDDGVGFDTTVSPPEGHHGLRNMAARARAIGGALQIKSRPGAGTTLSVVLPASREAG
jgi:PAS domain S-box-containing protein